MKDPRILHYAGTNEEDEAHLRLLLRSARKRLSESWAWGSASEADLVLMDANLATGDSPLAPASQKAVLTAQLIAGDDPDPTGFFLRRPFNGEAFAALLNEVTRIDFEAPTPLPMPSIPATVPSVITIAPNGDQNLMRSLIYYLPKRVLAGPARIAMRDAPSLVIDPESRMFWAEGSLPALEPYFRGPLRFGDWYRVTEAELDDVRKLQPARVSACLIWMDTYLQSKGVLSRRFDPEGTYRLTQRLELANDYPRALRISGQMTQPRRLDAIARASGADISEVHDVVNAYEAIGYLEWTRSGAAPRPRT